jgi:hypothetical protein
MRQSRKGEQIMSSIYEAKEEMHQIEAQLYPNHLAGGENTYLKSTLSRLSSIR